MVRRKRISSISQRVAVTVSVMAFGSVVESYSCANPIRALLRVYFRTRVACTYVIVVHASTKKKKRKVKDHKCFILSLSLFSFFTFISFSNLFIKLKVFRNVKVLKLSKIKIDTKFS